MNTYKSKGRWSSVKRTIATVAILSSCITMSYSQASDANSDIYSGGNNIEQALSNSMRSEKEVELDTLRKPAEVLEFFQIKKGMKVIDVFAGEGYYTEILSHLVGPSGSVAMHNHSVWEAYSKKGSDERVKDNRLPNVYQVMQDLNNTQLKSSYYDAATIILGMHDMFLVSQKSESGDKIDSAAFLSSLYKAMKPGGMVGIIEHEANMDTIPKDSAELHRLNSHFIKKIMLKAGFVFEKQSNILKNMNDDYNKIVWSKGLRRHTDRAVLRFRKPS
jgi:predicted methyltransferase